MTVALIVTIALLAAALAWTLRALHVTQARLDVARRTPPPAAPTVHALHRPRPDQRTPRTARPNP